MPTTLSRKGVVAFLRSFIGDGVNDDGIFTGEFGPSAHLQLILIFECEHVRQVLKEDSVIHVLIVRGIAYRCT